MNSYEKIDEMIREKDPKGPRLAADMLESLVADIKYILLPDRRSTLCAVTLVNGFTVHGVSSMISNLSQDYDQEVGRITAYEKALPKIKDAGALLLAEKLHQDRIAKDNVLKGEQLYFIHHKGGSYKLLHIAKNEATLEDIAVYQGILDGVVYSRPASEFYEKFTCAVDLSDVDYYKLCLEDEYSKVLKEYSRLETMLGQGQPENFTDNEWWLIKRQLGPMRDYHEVLLARIAERDKSLSQ